MRKATLLLLALVLVGACGEDDIDSDEAARRAYLGLDGSIEKSLNLGFAGFNAASSANIDPQNGAGDTGGALTITGQVDQGASSNKEMRLYVGMVDYTDGPFEVEVEGQDDPIEVEIIYDTSATMTEQPYLHLSLRDIPTGTFTGELTGTYFAEGHIEGDVTLDLMMSGMIMDGGNNLVLRVVGSTTVTGTATSGDGLYDVNITL